jgi:stage II sporulation protein D
MLRAGAAALVLLVPAVAFPVETMRIQMGDVAGEVIVSGAGLAFSVDREDAPLTAASGERSVVRAVDGRIEVDGAPWLEPAVRFRGSLPNGGSLSSVIRAGGFEVRGEVVIRGEGRALQLINVIALEEYLAAVLGSEMPSSFPEEALKAQAVAARTYALHKKLDAYDQPYHLGSSVLHQVYGGLKSEDARTRAAVEATRGEVLTWELQPIEAYFHASCGGRTEEGLPALSRDLPYLTSVSCPCGSAAASRWQATVSAREVAEALGAARAAELKVEARTRTGRVESLRAGPRFIDAVTFRRKLGYSRIKSLDFEVSRAGNDGLRFVGRGQGHGAGLCQWGARVLGVEGRSYREILTHYYPGTELQILY